MWEKIRYNADWLEDILELTSEYYGEVEIADKNYILHEYWENPSGEPTIHLAYDSENKVLAGQYVVIAQRISVKGKMYQAILSLNTLTREQYRGQKIFTTLAESVYEENAKNNIIGCYGAPNQNSHHGFVTKLGFQDIGIVPLYLCIMDYPILVKEKLGSDFLSKCAVPFNVFVRKIKEKNIKDVELQVITHENITLMDEFWNKIRDKYPVMVVRDSAFFQWRYLDMPIREYHIVAALKNGKVCGYIIGRITQVADMNCGMLVDFLVDKGEDEIGDLLIKKMKSYFVQKKVGLSGCLMQPFTEEKKLLKKNGYFRCPHFLEPQPFPIIFRQFNHIAEDEIINNFNNWFFTMGDYDVI